MKIEDLGRDKTKLTVSSQPVIKSGPNRGYRFPEKIGRWHYAGGFDYYCQQSEQAAHYTWAKTLLSLGFRVGSADLDGVKSFYIFIG